jgi:hypothetical protein
MVPWYVNLNCQPGLVALARACGEACQLEDIRAKLACDPSSLPLLHSSRVRSLMNQLQSLTS